MFTYKTITIESRPGNGEDFEVKKSKKSKKQIKLTPKQEKMLNQVFEDVDDVADQIGSTFTRMSRRMDKIFDWFDKL